MQSAESLKCGREAAVQLLTLFSSTVAGKKGGSRGLKERSDCVKLPKMIAKTGLENFHSKYVAQQWAQNCHRLKYAVIARWRSLIMLQSSILSKNYCRTIRTDFQKPLQLNSMDFTKVGYSVQVDSSRKKRKRGKRTPTEFFKSICKKSQSWVKKLEAKRDSVKILLSCLLSISYQ